MTIDKMNDEIQKCDSLIKATQKKRESLIQERDREIMKQTQKIFARHNISIMELMKLKNASEEELKKILEIGKGGKPGDEKDKVY